MRSATVFGLGLLSLIFVCGCGGEQTPPAQATTAPTGTPGTPAVASNDGKLAPISAPEPEVHLEPHPLSGQTKTIEETHANGAPACKRTVVYDDRGRELLNGPFTRWSRYGQKLEESVYVLGARQGKLERWFENGQLMEQAYFVNDRLHGTYSSWNGQGQQLTAAEFENGVAHGKCKFWYANGQVARQVEYERGRTVGHLECWYDDGAKFLEANIQRSGESDDAGQWTFWDRQGRKRKEIVGSKTEVISTLYRPDGTKLGERIVQRGSNARTDRSWFSNGQLASQILREGETVLPASKLYDEQGKVVDSEAHLALAGVQEIQALAVQTESLYRAANMHRPPAEPGLAVNGELQAQVPDVTTLR